MPKLYVSFILKVCASLMAELFTWKSDGRGAGRTSSSSSSSGYATLQNSLISTWLNFHWVTQRFLHVFVCMCVLNRLTNTCCEPVFCRFLSVVSEQAPFAVNVSNQYFFAIFSISLNAHAFTVLALIMQFVKHFVFPFRHSKGSYNVVH